MSDEDLGGFALGRFVDGSGRHFPGLVVERRVRDLSNLRDTGTPLTMCDLLDSWDTTLERVTELAAGRDGDWHPLDDLTVLPPVEPGLVLQSGANYRQHVIDIVSSERMSVHGTTPEEARADATRMMDERAAHGSPYIFLGSPRAIVGPYDDVVLPLEGSEHDWELELAVVIGRAARRISRDDAMHAVAGFTICNDITTRDRVYRPDLKAIGTDWFSAKNAPSFLPTGPFLVPAQFVDDPMDVQITLRHNGVIRQDESTKDMIFDIAQLVEYASAITDLRPGDLLLTGSPAGNGAHWRTFLAEGDVMDSTVTGLGTQRNRCVAEVPRDG